MRPGRAFRRPVCEICPGTSAAFPAGELQPDAAVELQGDEPVGRHHDDAGDEEEQQQQGHVPARGAEGARRQAISARAAGSVPGRLRKSIRRGTPCWDRNGTTGP